MSENMVENQTSNTDLTGNIRHAKIPLPKPQVHAQHPFKNQKNHDSLREYIQQRLYLAMQNRDGELNRLVEVDKNVAGWMRLSREDRERQRKQRKDGIPLAVEINLPLAYVHLDDMMTYFATTFSPNRGMFYQAGKPAEQGSAQQIVTLMNNHAIYAGYFREVLQGVYSLLKYNRGGFHVYWAQENGPKISVDPTTQQQQVTSELRWQGNKLEAIDIYNTLYDSAVTPAKLHCDGEFVAMPSSKSYHWLQNKAAQGVYYNCDSALSDWNGTNMYRYYRNPPKQANMEADDSGGTDWKSILMGSEVTGFGAAFEVTPIYIRLNPTEFGLIDGTSAQRAARNRLEIWRFTLLNDKYIIDATYMNNIHGYLPVFMGVLNDDIMSTAQKSAAEILQPLQNFASSLLNTHVQSNRKNLWNLTIYDPSMVDLKEIPQGEVAARIPIKPEAMGRDIRTGLWTPGGELDTQQTMKDLSGVMDIINQFFPTQSMPSQVANIDRAIDSQVAAVQQGANRRQQKSARLLMIPSSGWCDSQCTTTSSSISLTRIL